MNKKSVAYLLPLAMLLPALLLLWPTTRTLLPPRPLILVSIPPYHYLLEQLVEETATVRTALAPGSDLHAYEPTPQALQQLQQAAVWIGIGAPYEEKLWRALGANKPRSLQVEAPYTGSCCGHERDIHAWMSPRRIQQHLDAITAFLQQTFPHHARRYAKNCAALAAKLAALDRWIAGELRDLPSRNLLLAHPALTYFCADYGLKQFAMEKEGKQLGLRQLIALCQQLEQEGALAVFLQRHANNKAAELLATTLRVPSYWIDPLAKEYIAGLQQIVAAIKAASQR